MKKFLSIFGCLMLFISNSVLAYTAETNFWRDRQTKKMEKPVQLAQLPAPSSLPANFSSFKSLPVVGSLASPVSSVSPSVYSVPYQLGTIRHIHQSDSDQTIFHIQDVHLNTEAQNNIGETIEYLKNQGLVDVVALEGAFGDIELEKFREFPHQDTKKIVGNYFLKKGKMSGPIYKYLLSDQSTVPYVGVDDSKLYHKNVQAFLEANRLRNELKKELTANLDKHGKRESGLNSNLKNFHEHVQSYQKKAISFGDYVKGLRFWNGLDKKFEAIPIFLTALNYERKLDFNQVDFQRNQILTNLVSRISPGESKQLYEMSYTYKNGTISHSHFYQYLTNLFDDHGVSLDESPKFRDYVDYIVMSQKIDVEQLLKEVRNLEEMIYDRLAKTEKERMFIKKSRELFLQGQLLDFALTKEEWEEYKRFSLKIVPLPNGERPGVGPPTLALPQRGRELSLEGFEEFYHLAEQRDFAISRNLKKQIQKHQAKRIVLVTGGFHSKGIRHHFRDVNFVSFTPKVTKIETESGLKALSIFAQEKTPLEKLFDGDKLFLSPKVVPDSRLMGLFYAAHRGWHNKERFWSTLRSLMPNVKPKGLNLEREDEAFLLKFPQLIVSFFYSDKGEMAIKYSLRIFAVVFALIFFSQKISPTSLSGFILSLILIVATFWKRLQWPFVLEEAEAAVTAGPSLVINSLQTFFPNQKARLRSFIKPTTPMSNTTDVSAGLREQDEERHFFTGKQARYRNVTAENFLDEEKFKSVFEDDNGNISEESLVEIRRFQNKVLPIFENFMQNPYNHPLAGNDIRGYFLSTSCELCSTSVVSQILIKNNFLDVQTIAIQAKYKSPLLTGHTFVVVKIAGQYFVLDLTAFQFEVYRNHLDVSFRNHEERVRYRDEFEHWKQKTGIVMIPFDDLEQLQNQESLPPFYDWRGIVQHKSDLFISEGEAFRDKTRFSPHESIFYEKSYIQAMSGPGRVLSVKALLRTTDAHNLLPVENSRGTFVGVVPFYVAEGPVFAAFFYDPNKVTEGYHIHFYKKPEIPEYNSESEKVVDDDWNNDISLGEEAWIYNSNVGVIPGIARAEFSTFWGSADRIDRYGLDVKFVNGSEDRYEFDASGNYIPREGQLVLDGPTGHNIGSRQHQTSKIIYGKQLSINQDTDNEIDVDQEALELTAYMVRTGIFRIYRENGSDELARDTFFRAVQKILTQMIQINSGTPFDIKILIGQEPGYFDVAIARHGGDTRYLSSLGELIPSVEQLGWIFDPNPGYDEISFVNIRIPIPIEHRLAFGTWGIFKKIGDWLNVEANWLVLIAAVVEGGLTSYIAQKANGDDVVALTIIFLILFIHALLGIIAKNPETHRWEVVTIWHYLRAPPEKKTYYRELFVQSNLIAFTSLFSFFPASYSDPSLFLIYFWGIVPHLILNAWSAFEDRWQWPITFDMAETQTTVGPILALDPTGILFPYQKPQLRSFIKPMTHMSNTTDAAAGSDEDRFFFTGEQARYRNVTAENFLDEDRFRYLFEDENGEIPDAVMQELERFRSKVLPVMEEFIKNPTIHPNNKTGELDNALSINCVRCSNFFVSPLLVFNEFKNVKVFSISADINDPFLTGHTVVRVEISGRSFMIDLTAFQFEMIMKYREDTQDMPTFYKKHRNVIAEMRQQTGIVMIPAEELDQLIQNHTVPPFYDLRRVYEVRRNINIYANLGIKTEPFSPIDKVTFKFGGIYDPYIEKPRLQIDADILDIDLHGVINKDAKLIPTIISEGPVLASFFYHSYSDETGFDIYFYKKSKMPPHLHPDVRFDLVKKEDLHASWVSNPDVAVIADVDHAWLVKDEGGISEKVSYELRITYVDGDTDIFKFDGQGNYVPKDGQQTESGPDAFVAGITRDIDGDVLSLITKSITTQSIKIFEEEMSMSLGVLILEAFFANNLVFRPPSYIISNNDESKKLISDFITIAIEIMREIGGLFNGKTIETRIILYMKDSNFILEIEYFSDDTEIELPIEAEEVAKQLQWELTMLTKEKGKKAIRLVAPVDQDVDPASSNDTAPPGSWGIFKRIGDWLSIPVELMILIAAIVEGGIVSYIAQKTSGDDFVGLTLILTILTLHAVLGIIVRDPETQKWEVITIWTYLRAPPEKKTYYRELFVQSNLIAFTSLFSFFLPLILTHHCF